jgi:hypothetical protein
MNEMVLYRWGQYLRCLILYSGVVVKVVIQRYYSPETKRTYSLLPFYITRYQRYINTIIEEVLIQRLVEGQSYEQIEQNGPPLKKTICRWNKWVSARLDVLREKLTMYLVHKNSEYFSVSTAKNGVGEKLEDLLAKGKLLSSKEENIQYGSLSYILYNLQ